MPLPLKKDFPTRRKRGRPPKKVSEEDTAILSLPEEEKEKLRLDFDIQIAELEAQEAVYKEQNKIEFFQPLYYQQKAFDFVYEGKKTVILQGSNQIGKTIWAIVLIICYCLGYAPWTKREDEPEDKKGWLFIRGFWYRESPLGMRKVIGRILCNDWEKSARDTIVPKLKEWLPFGCYETKKNNVGVEHEFYFPSTGSKFTILTYKEDTKSHEGWTGDFVHCDEPPPQDKYTANRRGLVARNGVLTIAMTALDQPWILDEIIEKPDPSHGIVGGIRIRENPTLTEEAIRIFENSCPEDEKIARIDGGWKQLVGRIWKVFDVNWHTCDPFAIPPDWPVQFQIDFHLNLPHAIIFYACDKYGRFFYFGEVWENMTTEEIADTIIRTKLSMCLRLTYGEIDALSKGDTAYIRNRIGKAEDSFTIIERKLRKFGIRLGVGSKDEKSYIKAVEGMLKGPNGEPLIKIFNDCPETIKQVSRWSYDDNKPKPDGHFPECIGRSTQTGLKYTDPSVYSQPLPHIEVGVI